MQSTIENHNSWKSVNSYDKSKSYVKSNVHHDEKFSILKINENFFLTHKTDIKCKNFNSGILF